MSDFDFDEIDKAVNGALGTEPASEEPVLAPEEDNASDQTTQSTPAARRGPSGRFMDMVHPSSDMRRAGSEVPARTTASASDSRIPEPPAFFQTPETRETAETSEAQSNNWSTPPESPFLADAKVEKRPLGGVGDAPAPLGSLFTQPTEELLEAPEEELKLEASEEPLLEATTLPDPIDFSQSLESAKQEVEEKPVEAAPIETSHDEPSPALEEVLSGPISITQQYKEQPAATQESGAIYDTESYHQALVAPVKKRSGAWVFLWIFILVIVGAGIGAALYLYVLPNI